MRIFTSLAVLFCFSLCSIPNILFAQTFPMVDGTTVNTCSGFFTDSGGNSNGYAANEDITMTFCPDMAGQNIQLQFSGVDILAGDDMCFYDGPDTGAPQIGANCYQDEFGSSAFTIQASAVNPSGCLTIVFQSDGTNQGAGWSANINCISDCQNIFVELFSSDPPVSPADTGWIDICPGDRVAFEGRGIYPQDGEVYNHSDLTSSFVWDFGDGTSAVGPSVTHVYDEPGGYTVQLQITDQNECTNLNFLSQRVRVSTYPDFSAIGDLPDQICAGDTLDLAASINTPSPGSILNVSSNQGGFQTAGIVSDSLPLPDGTGVSYSTSIVFTDFSPGQLLSDINDFLGICVNMEHTWMHDLDIFIECPNGTQVQLQDHELIFNRVFLGEPVENDNNEDPPPPGVGYDYCWTPSSTNGTWTEFSQANDPGGGPYTLPPGDYESFEDLENLLGCPLNGEWTIEVVDEWGQDNGWIFEWSIDFNQNVYPNLEIYEPQLVDFQWLNNSSIISYSGDSLGISAVPTLGGETLYTFEVEDNFGCVYDTSLTFDVLPFAHPDCYNCQESIAPLSDTTICSGEIISLDASVSTPPATISGYQTTPLQPFEWITNPPSNPLYSPIDVEYVNPATLDDPATQIVSVCIEIETDWNADLTIILEGPSGTQMLLSSNNGGASQDYIQTCFTPSATVPVTSGTGPFTGTFLPEGDWSVLTGEVINGEWNLVVTDNTNNVNLGELVSWSITFNSVNEPTYTWSGAGLSCTNCPNPDITATSTGDYTVTSMDSYGCSFSETITVTTLDNIPAPTVDCISNQDQTISFSWLPVGTYTEYEYRVITNGAAGAWVGPVTDLTHTTNNNLIFGDEVTLEVRVFISGTPADCEIAIGSATCVYAACSISANLLSAPEAVSCFGEDDGSVQIEAMGGDLPLSYTLLGEGIVQDNGIFSTLTAGNYAIEVLDNVGCADTVNFEILQPDSLTAEIVLSQAIDCNSASTGVLSSVVDGGTPAYNYQWSTSPLQSGASASMLNAGTYSLTVTDAENCIATASFDLNEPDSISISLNASDASCPNIADGSIQATASGGTAPLTLNWSNTETGNEISNLVAGNYCVTVEDANGCQKVACIDVNAPNALTIDSVSTTSVLCNGENTGTATVFISGGFGDYSYQWNDDLAQTGETAISLEANDYMVTITDENGCEVNTQITVEEPEVLSVDFSFSDALCNDGNDGAATAFPAGGVEPYNYNWQNGQTEQTIENLSADNYSLTITDANGCMLESDISIGEPDTEVSVSFDQTVLGCFNEQQNEVLATASGGTGTNYTYSWSDGQSNALAVGLDDIAYSITVTDENGCEAISSFIPTDLDEIDFLIINTPPSCNGFADGRLGINQISGGAGVDITDYTIEWSSGATGPTAENLAGDVEYSVTVTDPQGCQSIKTRLLQQPSPISFTVEPEDVLCFGEATGRASVQNIIGDHEPFTFLWSDGQDTDVAIGLSAGEYAVTVTDDTGCLESLSVSIGEPEELTVEFTTEDSPCFGDAGGSIMATAEGGIPTYSFSWSNGSNQSNLESLTAGDYILTLTDQNGCEEMITASINQPDRLQATFETTDPSCSGFRDGSISILATGGTIPYRYSTDGDFFIGSSMLIALEADDYQVTIRDANGCLFTDRVDLFDPPALNVNAGSDSYSIILGDSIRLYGSAENAIGEVDYFWEAPYDGTLSCNNCKNTTSTPSVSILYELIGVDENGCEDSDMVWVYVEKPRLVAVPTGFTPNGDSNNDNLLVHGRRGTMVQYFQVFDRWGELVFENRDFEVNDPTAGWDGTFKGEQVASGVYVWQLLVTYEDGMEEAYSGETTLIR
jgi:gliding motility-associated-like protein